MPPIQELGVDPNIVALTPETVAEKNPSPELPETQSPNDLFPSLPEAQKKAWVEFTTTIRHDWKEYAAIIGGDAKGKFLSVYQQLALQVLLTPDVRILPFSTRQASTDQDLWYRTCTDFSEIEFTDPSIVAQIIEELPLYRAQAQKYLETAEEPGRRKGYGSEILQEKYNSLILKLLPEVSEDQAEALFNEYNFSLEQNGDYDPFLHVWENEKIGDIWKQRVFEDCYDKISLPGEEANTHFRQLYKDVKELLSLEKLPVSPELFEDIIDTIINHPRRQQYPIVDSQKFARALSYLTKKETRLAFVKRHVLSKQEPFFSSLNPELAHALLEEFPEDGALTAALVFWLTAYTRRTEQSLKKVEEFETYRIEILDALRIPEED